MKCCSKKLCGLLVLVVCVFENGCRKKPAITDYSKAESLSITFGQVNRESGLRQVLWEQDGHTDPAVLQEQECRIVNRGRRGESFDKTEITDASAPTASLFVSLRYAPASSKPGRWGFC